MCGIMCQIRYTHDGVLKDNKILQRIKNRGPDCNYTLNISLVGGITLTFCGAVLWMRGPKITPQPVENERGLLLFNGDIFDETWNISTNDTELILKKLGDTMDDNSENHIVKELKLLKGPFSIIYYNKSTQQLYFTRDRIGRNSLLFHRDQESIMISSVLGRNYNCVEIPATSIYILNIQKKKIKLYSWDNGDHISEWEMEDWLERLQKQQSLPDEEFTFNFDDSTMDNCQEDDVARYIQNIALEFKCKLTVMKKILDHVTVRKTVFNLTELLEKSIKLRLKTQPQKCRNCINLATVCDHCSVGVLFSGGLDCTILAFLANKYLPKQQPIELLNVAFKKENMSYDVPDRITGRQSFEELKKLCPSRVWLFKEINISKKELEEHQIKTIADLVYPRQTILDESLGSALWFAARGMDANSESSCRILLLGSGADELFGGYTRHRNSFKRHGWSGLDKELQLDWRRISFRNLARDNRVICDHGRQPRMPYLDEDFTDYVLKLKPWLKCYPSDSLGQGVGDKLMLRLMAFNLGLTEVMSFPKRALQFGTRIANKKEKGSDLSNTFKNVK